METNLNEQIQDDVFFDQYLGSPILGQEIDTISYSPNSNDLKVEQGEGETEPLLSSQEPVSFDFSDKINLDEQQKFLDQPTKIVEPKVESKQSGSLLPLDYLGEELNNFDYPDLSLIGDVSQESDLENHLFELLGINDSKLKEDLLQSNMEKKNNKEKELNKKRTNEQKQKQKQKQKQNKNQNKNQKQNKTNKRYHLRNSNQALQNNDFNLIWMIDQQEDKSKKNKKTINTTDVNEKSNGLQLTKKKKSNPRKRKKSNTVRKNSQPNIQKKRRTNKSSALLDKKRAELAKITDVKKVRKLPEEEKRLRRLEKNRESARKIREKKRMELENLRNRVAELEKANKQYQDELKIKDKEIQRLQFLCEKHNVLEVTPTENGIFV
ncbi:basic-leucine zipper transcription factor f-related [Anaeramoeba flamelloides]|uniref:Basic-leucine zipper transcription factor f-related n=1 Tax=Anaeramoeba flamelloides TaxID=1746091 RepID=A0ABQ8Y1Q1_9EUKA|nr:basic-leucine zipper transcription factor f-related [Anaeramoeba flamelloides]